MRRYDVRIRKNANVKKDFGRHKDFKRLKNSYLRNQRKNTIRLVLLIAVLCVIMTMLLFMFF